MCSEGRGERGGGEVERRERGGWGVEGEGGWNGEGGGERAIQRESARVHDLFVLKKSILNTF